MNRSQTKEIIDFSLISTPHIAGHSLMEKLNGTINLINDLQKFLEIDESIQENKKMRSYLIFK